MQWLQCLLKEYRFAALQVSIHQPGMGDSALCAHVRIPSLVEAHPAGNEAPCSSSVTPTSLQLDEEEKKKPKQLKCSG